MHAYYHITVKDEHGIVTVRPKCRVPLEVESGMLQTTYIRLPFRITPTFQSGPDDPLPKHVEITMKLVEP